MSTSITSEAPRAHPIRRRSGAPGAPPGATAPALALLAFGANMASPLYPGYQARLGFDDLVLTLVYATYAVASVPALLVLGPLGDLVGRTRLVRGGLLVAAAGSVCFALGTHVELLFAGRVLQGVALGAATGAGMALLAEAATPARRRRVAAAGALAFVAGTAAGPGLTGLLADVVPAPLTTVHLLHAAAIAVVYLRLGRSARPVPMPRWPSARPQLPVHGRDRYLVATATGFVSWAVVGVFLGVVPSVVARDAGAGGTAVPGAVASAVVLAALPAQLVVPRLGAGRAQLAGLGLLGAGLVALVVTGAALPWPVLLGAALVGGVGHGLAYGGAHGVVEGTAVGPRAAGVTATAYVVYYLGAGVPTVVVGVLSPVLSLSGATALLAGLLLVAAVAVVVRLRSLDPARHARRLDEDSVSADVADLIRGVLSGVHQANGVWHGVRPPGPARPRRP